MRFALKVFILFLIIYFSIFILLKDELFGEDYAVMDFKFNKLPKIIRPNSILLFGDSALMNAADPRKLNENSYNVTIPCGSFFEFYTLLNRLEIDKLKPRFVILSMHIKRASNQENCLQDMLLPYNILSFNELKSLFFAKEVLNFLNKKTSFDLLADLLLFKSYFHAYQINSIQIFVTGKNNELKLRDSIYSSLDDQRGHFRCAAPTEFPFDNPQDSYSGSFKMSEFDLAFFYAFLSKLREKNIKVLYLNPVYSETYRKLLSEVYLESQHQFYKKIERESGNFIYDSEVNFVGNDLFQDSAHVNEKGTDFYTKWVNKKIEFYFKNNLVQ